MGDERSSKEMRKETRLRSRLPVYYRVGEEREVRAGFLLDVGAGGLRLELSRKPKVPGPIAVIVQLPEEGKVIRLDGTTVGVGEAGQVGTYSVRVIFDKEVVEHKDIAKIRDHVEKITESLLGRQGAESGDLFGRKMGIKQIVEVVNGLEMSMDEEKKTCTLGELLTFDCHEVDGLPPMTIAAKVSEMLAVALVRKYEVSEEVVNEALAQCKAGLNDFGKRYFMNVVRRKTAGGT